MRHKNDYSAIVFFETQKPKKWAFIHKLSTFRNFLDKQHSSWEYMNVYDRRNKTFLRRLHKDEVTPDFIEISC